MRILVTGATGYIGGRLVEELLAAGHDVRVLVRSASRAASRTWSDQVEVREGDLLAPDSLQGICDDVDTAYYLVHSMGGDEDFAERDRRAAGNFAHAAKGVSQVIYLGGLLPQATPDREVSEHLSSRAEVGQVLRDALPTTEFRAGPIIGSGSASFEMVRYLTERLPVMVAPKWIMNDVQPIGIRDILAYLVDAAGRTDVEGVVEVGADPLTFKQMMEVYADERGLPRLIYPLPVLAPKLAALWVGLVTPIPNSLAVPLVEGVVHPVLADTDRAERLFPSIRPITYREAVSLAIQRTEAGDVVTRWSGAVGGRSGVRFEDREGIVREVRTRLVDASPEATYRSFASLGGARGWRVWNWAWSLRGLVDQVLGGPGLRRGRRHPTELFPGESLDFWRVEDVQPPTLLRLRAEMKVPGQAWLQFETCPEDGKTRLIQTAYFAPMGFFGWLYWYGIYPLHALIFSSLVAAIASDAEAGIPS
ncbi:MAG: DUF2867 domain-containing protein [Gemmatimonadetes bacterium]|nr:DUF2867 domain-containing protein [Gemmatimonadota bacterium]